MSYNQGYFPYIEIFYKHISRARIMIERVIDMEEKILRLLQKNARMSKEEIAVMLGISEEEVEAQIAAFEVRHRP